MLQTVDPTCWHGSGQLRAILRMRELEDGTIHSLRSWSRVARDLEQDIGKRSRALLS